MAASVRALKLSPRGVDAMSGARARNGARLRAPQRFAHRDFQSKNVIVCDATPTRGRVAMIDLQGAFLAPPEYDFVCLLRDSYIELPEAFVESELARLRPALPAAPDAASRPSWNPTRRSGF